MGAIYKWIVIATVTDIVQFIEAIGASIEICRYMDIWICGGIALKNIETCTLAGIRKLHIILFQVLILTGGLILSHCENYQGLTDHLDT